MSFEELMKAPIPESMRRSTNINESVNECGNCGTECGTECGDCDPVATPPISMPADPTPGPVDPVIPATDETPAGADTLTPDESQRVDDVMNTVATPLLLTSELDGEETKEFVEGIDSDIAIAEGFLTERTIVRFDKNAKKAQLYEVAVRAVAREKKDPLYRKLETVEKMKRIIEAKLRKKYDAPARKKVKEYLDRAKKSKSGILAKIANKISGR